MHAGEAPTIGVIEPELLTVLEFNGAGDGDGHGGRRGAVRHVGESKVGEHPFSLEESEVTHGLLLLGREPFVVTHEPIRVPLKKILVGIDHESVVVGFESPGAQGVKIKHRQHPFKSGAAKGADGFRGVGEDIPLVAARGVGAGL